MKTIHAWFDVNLLKIRENITNQEFDIDSANLYSDDQLPHNFVPDKMINERGQHLIKIELEDFGMGMFEVESIKFADSSMANIESLLDKVEIEKRRSMSEQKPVGRPGKPIYLYRAMDGFTDTFKPMDYVMGKTMPLTPADIKQVKDYFEDEEPVTRQGAKLLLWVAEHAQNNAVVYGKNFVVGALKADSGEVYEASNPGEMLYDGDIKASTILFGFDENGIMFDPKPHHENEMSY